MPENQTRETRASVQKFIAGVANDRRREDAKALLAMIQRVTRTKPKMWGPAIIGFGSCHYKYDSGREGDMPMLGFSPRKASLVLYLAKPSTHAADLKRLGTHKAIGSCLYVNKLSDVDLKVLEQMLRASWKEAKKKHGTSSV